MSMKKLSEAPLVHETAEVESSTLGRWTEIAERCRVSESVIGDYSYMMQDCGVWCAGIGKFSNIAASVRINATNHPVSRPTLHHFTYRASDYWDDAEHETDFFAQRRRKARHDRPRHMARPRLDHPARRHRRRWRRCRRGRCGVEGCRALHDRRRRTGKADPRALRPPDRRAVPDACLVGLGPCPPARGAQRFPGAVGGSIPGKARRVDGSSFSRGKKCGLPSPLRGGWRRSRRVGSCGSAGRFYQR